MGRVVAIDLGQVRIGVAISDPSRIITSSLGKIERKKENGSTIEALFTLLEPYKGQIDEILIGYPLHLSGKLSPMAQEVTLFKSSLEEKSPYKVRLWDERLSSLQAERVLREGEMNRKKRKEVIDGLSAAIILESYLFNNY